MRSPALAKMLEEHKKNFIKLLGVEEDSKRDDVLNFVQSIERQLPEIRPQNRRRAAREGSVATATNSPQKNGGKLEWDVAPIPKESIHARPISLDVSYEELPVAGETIHLRKLAIDERWESRIHTPHASSIGLRHELLKPQPRHRALYSISIRDIHTNGTSEASDPTPITSYLQDKAKPSPTSVGALLLGKALPSAGVGTTLNPLDCRFFVEEEDEEEYLVLRQVYVGSNLTSQVFKIKLQEVHKHPVLKEYVPGPYQPYQPESTDFYDLDAHSWSHIKFFVEEYCLVRRQLFYNGSLVSIVRLHMVSLILTRLAHDPRSQIACGIVLELICLVFALKSHAKKSRVFLWVEFALTSWKIVYLVLKIVSTMDSLTEETRQTRIGLLMADVICLICLINVLFVLYELAVCVIEVAVFVWSKLRKWSPSAK